MLREMLLGGEDDDDVEVVTGGTPGIPADFVAAWGGPRLDVVSMEYLTDYIERTGGKHPYRVVPRSQKDRRIALSKLDGIVCALFIQGGQYSTHEIKLFQERGVPIVPLYSGGGAAGGELPYEGWSYTAPEDVLHSVLADPGASAEHAASVLAHRIADIVQSRHET